LQIFNPEVTLTRDQVWINDSAYGPRCSGIEVNENVNSRINLSFVSTFHPKLE